jgi:hypothetical protein
MNSDIYEKVKDLACSLVNASGSGDTKEYWNTYQELSSLCDEYEGGALNHPFQWETLADFTTDDAASVELYEKAFALAEELKLSNYMSSIKLAVAERYLELGLESMAFASARKANEYAIKLDDLELRKEISEFLLNETNGT